MNKNTKYQILKYSLIVLLLAFSFFLWHSVDRAILVEGASVWTAPIAWSSLFFITLTLSVFLIKERAVYLLAMAFSFLMGLAYSFSLLHLLILILAIIFILVAEGKMRDDFRERLKINLGKNIRAGSTFIVLALSLAISAQYYFVTKDLATEKYLPRFEVGKSTSGLMLKIVANFLPQAKDLGDPEMTVDQFLLSLYAKQKSDAKDNSLLEAQLKNLGPAERILAESVMRDAEENMALSEGRKQLAQLTLRNVSGGEKISDVFSEIVNKKISGYFVPNFGAHGNSALFSAILALLILIAVYSLGASLMLFWIPLIKLIFSIFKKSGLISVMNIPAEKEIIE